MSGSSRIALATFLAQATVGAAFAAPAAAPILPSAGPLAMACEAQAARYENGKGFTLSVIRAGDVRIDNPLRPLTPDFTHVLEVVIGGKRATAFGPDFTTLRRGGPPGAMQNTLGAPIRWAPSLPGLPETLGIVAEDGSVLASLTFRACEPPPAAAPEPPPKVAKEGKPGAKTAGKTARTAKPGAKGQAKSEAKSQAKAPEKTPAGFTMPAGALPE
ncbi:MAG: hypothetical protein INR70_17350 [Parafilimonas terrae]|nr:hypothetical protein [Parafilimonas terrae]